MAGKEFAFGFILSAALSSGFGKAFGTANKLTEELGRQSRKAAEMQAALSGAMKNGVISAKSYANAQMRASAAARMLSAKKMRSEFTSIAENARSLALLGAGLYAPISAAMKFESTMADVRKVVDFDTPQQFKEMSKDILELSQRIPMTAEGLGQIVAAGGQSGIARDELVGFAESAAKMGVAFDITADQAGEMMAKWRTAFKMNQTDVIALADKINYLGNTTAASAPLISDVVTRIGPLGEVGGVASGEIAALGASLVGSGINSEIAATGIKNMILAMVSGESATRSQAEAFARLGIDTAALAQRMQTDAKGAILDLLQSVQALDGAEQASVLQQIFGKESLGAIAPLLSNLDGLRENFAKVGSAANYAGSMQAEFDARAQTTENSVQLMNNRLDAAQIAIGNGLLPVITPAAEALGGLATALGGIAESCPWLISGVAGTIAAVYAAKIAVHSLSAAMAFCKTAYYGVLFAVNAWRSGLVAATVSAYAQRVATIATATAAKIAAAGHWLLTGAQWALNTAILACPIGWLIAGIAALVAAGVWLYQNWGTVKAWFATLWTDPAKALEEFCAGVRERFGAVWDWVSEKWQSLKNLFSSPITAAIETKSTGGASVAHNASGGIYGKGAFLTTFAEDSAEAAIPLDGSPRAKSLWAQAGEALGMPAASGGNISVEFSPTINISGNADAAVVNQAMQVTMRDLKRMLADIAGNGRRLSYE